MSIPEDKTLVLFEPARTDGTLVLLLEGRTRRDWKRSVNDDDDDDDDYVLGDGISAMISMIHQR